MAKQGDVCSENRWLIVLVVLNMFAAFESKAQLRDINSLSSITSHELPGEVRFPALIHYSSIQYPDLLTYFPDSSSFVILKNEGNGSMGGMQSVGYSANVTNCTVGNINNDGIDDFVVVHRDMNSIEVFTSTRTDSTYSSFTFPVNFYPERAIIGDITNDRIPDVISFGKLSSGLSVLQGKGNGKFHSYKTIFENIPVSDCALIALNGDNIPDVAIHNWLMNETTIHLGLGRLKFSEQTVLSFSQDTVQSIFSDFTGDGIADVAVLSIQNKTVQILDGDGLGNFSFAQALPISFLSYQITVGSFTAPHSSDLLIYNNAANTMSLLNNRSDGTFYDEIVFGTGIVPTTVVTGDVNGDGIQEVLSFPTGKNQYAIFWNSCSKISRDDRKQTFGVGQFPSNLYVSDITGDGFDDIVVSNEGSSSISILRSIGDSFAGQLTIETPEKPVSVSLYAKSDSSITLYSLHRENPKVSLYSLHREKDSLNSLVGDLEQFSISLPDKPVNVLPDVSFMQRGISLYAFMSTAPNAIMFYQQVKGTRFLAKSLVPLVPAKIAYSTISDLNSDGKTDLLYVYTNTASKNTHLGVTLNDSIGEFKGKVYTFPLPDTSVRKALLFIDDFNGDQLKDCLLYLAPENSLRLALGNINTLFGAFEEIVDSVSIKGPEQLQLYDINNDGIMDIIYFDKESSIVWSYRGKGNGKFLPRKSLVEIPGGATFRCGDFNGDGFIDIVYTESNGHTVTVIYGT
ncbi:MAG: VCBS repeat-containing protein [Bacteriovoracaceae bacterium]